MMLCEYSYPWIIFPRFIFGHVYSPQSLRNVQIRNVESNDPWCPHRRVILHPMKFLTSDDLAVTRRFLLDR